MCSEKICILTRHQTSGIRTPAREVNRGHLNVGCAERLLKTRNSTQDSLNVNPPRNRDAHSPAEYRASKQGRYGRTFNALASIGSH